MTSTTPPAPQRLGTHGRRLWRDVLAEYELSAPELALLEVAGHAVDRQLEAEALIDKEGLTIDGRFECRDSPHRQVGAVALVVL